MERIYCEDHDRIVRDGLPDGSAGAVRREIERYDKGHENCNLMIEIGSDA